MRSDDETHIPRRFSCLGCAAGLCPLRRSWVDDTAALVRASAQVDAPRSRPPSVSRCVVMSVHVKQRIRLFGTTTQSTNPPIVAHRNSAAGSLLPRA